MKRSILKKIGLSSAMGFSAIALLVLPNTASAVQFSYLDPGYTQEIYTGSISTGWGPGFAWNSAGNMVLRGNNVLYEYSLTADTTYQGTSVHSYTTHTVSGLGWGGYGMTTGLDGYAYANTSSGVARIDMNTWTATTFAGSAGGYYGIATLADGRIVHSDNYGIYVLDPVTGVDTLIYSSPSFIDGIAIAPTGEIFLADLGSYRIRVINASGTVINDVAVAHGPDGMAFGNGAAYASNVDGTITRLDFAGPGYTGAVTESIFASGGSYGDLAAVGPDGAFYVSQWNGVDWDNGTTSGQAIIKIAAVGGGGFEPPPGTSVPEPGTLLLVGSGLVGFVYTRKKMKK